MMNDIIKKIKQIPGNIKAVLQWSKILWNNFDWDDGYLLDVIEYKLTRMKKYFESADFIVQEEYDKITAQIDIALNACHQLTSRDFEIEILNTHYDKYPFYLDEWFDDKGVIHSGMLPMEGEERESWMAMHKILEEKELEYNHQLFDTMRDYHDWWWD